MKKTSPIVSGFLLFFPIIIGSVPALFLEIGDSYRSFEKPPFSPPGIVFPIVWTLLYLLMGISSFLIYKKCKEEKLPLLPALVPFYLQLLLNVFWTFLFFGLGAYLLGALWIFAMIAVILWMISRFRQIDRIAAVLQIPYLLWCCFAAYLSLGVYLLN